MTEPQRKSGKEMIGYIINNIFHEKINDDVYNNEIVGKSSTSRSRIKDENRGDNVLKYLATTGLLGVGLNSTISDSLTNLDDMLKKIDLLSDKNAVIPDLANYLSISHQEWFNNSGVNLFLYHMNEMLGTKILLDDFYTMSASLITLGGVATGIYLLDNEYRLNKEEKIAKYSDMDKEPEKRINKFLNDRMAYNLIDKSMFFTNSNGLLSKGILGFLSSANEVLNIPDKILKKIAKSILKNDKDKNMFEKGISLIYDNFLPHREALAYVAEEQKSLFQNDTIFKNTINLKKEIQKQTKIYQSITNESDYSYVGTQKTIIADACQEKVKRDILKSLIKAIMSNITEEQKESPNKNSISAFLKSKLAAKSKDLKIIEEIKNLHNMKVEQKFDHYEAISHVANLYLKNKEKIKQNVKQENIENFIIEELEKKSFDLSFNHFWKEVEDQNINNLKLENPVQLNNLKKTMKKLLSENKNDVFSNEGFNSKPLNNIRKELSIFFKKHPKYIKENTNEFDVIEKMVSNSQIFFQDYTNRNIVNETASLSELMENRLMMNKSFARTKDLSNDNTYAALSSSRVKYKIN